jgi:hypothetical protein
VLVSVDRLKASRHEGWLVTVDAAVVPLLVMERSAALAPDTWSGQPSHRATDRQRTFLTPSVPGAAGGYDAEDLVGTFGIGETSAEVRYKLRRNSTTSPPSLPGPPLDR